MLRFIVISCQLNVRWDYQTGSRLSGPPPRTWHPSFTFYLTNGEQAFRPRTWHPSFTFYLTNGEQAFRPRTWHPSFTFYLTNLGIITFHLYNCLVCKYPLNHTVITHNNYTRIIKQAIHKKTEKCHLAHYYSWDITELLEVNITVYSRAGEGVGRTVIWIHDLWK